MRNRAYIATVILFTATASCFAASAKKDALGATDVTVVDGPYQVKGDLSVVVGFVLKRDANSALFKPCDGEAREIQYSDLKPTDLTCSDGTGSSFASAVKSGCDSSSSVEKAAVGFFAAKKEPVEVGGVYKVTNGQLAGVAMVHASSANQIDKIISCNNNWSIGYDAGGKKQIQMLAISPQKLMDTKNNNWK